MINILDQGFSKFLFDALFLIKFNFNSLPNELIEVWITKITEH